MHLNKFLEKISRYLQTLISDKYKLDHKFQNKNQITNSNLILRLLKNKSFDPEFIVDIGCGHGEWFLKSSKIFDKSFYYLFDANKNNEQKLFKLKNIYNNFDYKICLLSDDKKNYTFYNMGYGSSIFEEQTSYNRYTEELTSKLLIDELPEKLFFKKNNFMKIDVQGSEKKILDGLKDKITVFEVIILEVSLHQYNKLSPLFDEIFTYMYDSGFRLYDIYDLKRLGNYKSSFLLQFDCVFVRKNSNLLDVTF